MTLIEFNEVVKDHLTCAYGAHHFPQAVLKILWELVSPLTTGEFTRALQSMVEMDGGRIPNVAAIRKAVGPVLDRARTASRRAQIATLEADSGGCAICGGSGWAEATRRGFPDFYRFAFICPCPVSRVLGFKEGKGAFLWGSNKIVEGFSLVSMG